MRTTLSTSGFHRTFAGLEPKAHDSVKPAVPKPVYLQDKIRFSGDEAIKTLAYKALNPDLTPEEVSLYERAEREWHQLLDGINPATGFKTLLSRVEARGDVDVNYRPWMLSGKPGLKGSTNRETQNSRIRILLWDKNGYQNEAEQTEILAHEMLHVIHIRHGLLKSHAERVPDASVTNLRAFEAKIFRQDNLSEYASYYLTADKLGPVSRPTVPEVLRGLLRFENVLRDYRRKQRNIKLANTYAPFL